MRAFFSISVIGQLAIPSSKGERRGGWNASERGREREGARKRDKQRDGIKHTRADVERSGPPPLFSGGRKRTDDGLTEGWPTWQTRSLGTSPMNGLTRLRATLRDNHWGNLGAPLIHPSSPRLVLVILSFSLAPFARGPCRTSVARCVPRPRARSCTLSFPATLFSLSPLRARITCTAPVTFNRGERVAIKFHARAGNDLYRVQPEGRIGRRTLPDDASADGASLFWARSTAD